jgi:hypothetical protein
MAIPLQPPASPYFYGCDGRFTVDYREISEDVNLYGDAVVSSGGNHFVLGLDIGQFHTYRFETLDGTIYAFSVDGLVFHQGADHEGNAVHYLVFASMGGCLGDDWPNIVNEWDFVRYGTISSGERIVATDPPGGLLDASLRAGLDRFAVTFDSANYV